MTSLGQQDDSTIADRGPALITMMWSLTTISLFTIALRFTFRARKRQMGWEDILMGFTWVWESVKVAHHMLTTLRHVLWDGPQY